MITHSQVSVFRCLDCGFWTLETCPSDKGIYIWLKGAVCIIPLWLLDNQLCLPDHHQKPGQWIYVICYGVGGAKVWPCPNLRSLTNTKVALAQTKGVTSYPLLVHLFIYVFVLSIQLPWVQEEVGIKMDRWKQSRLRHTWYQLNSSPPVSAADLICLQPTSAARQRLSAARSLTHAPSRKELLQHPLSRKFTQPNSLPDFLRPTNKIFLHNRNEYICYNHTSIRQHVHSRWNNNKNLPRTVGQCWLFRVIFSLSFSLNWCSSHAAWLPVHRLTQGAK